MKKILTLIIPLLCLVWANVVSAQVLRAGIKGEPSSIDPHYHNLTPNNALAREIFDRLIMPDDKQRLQPGLAVSWKAVDDLTWEFKLRKGVKFHDGSPFTADDVVFTFERAPNVPNSPSSFMTYLKGKKISKIDDHTVHIKTERPYPLMPNDMMTFSIISKKHGQGATTEVYNNGKAAIGTGQFKFVEWIPGDRLVLERNENYWGKSPNGNKSSSSPSNQLLPAWQLYWQEM